jgi:hypothetical protein
MDSAPTNYILGQQQELETTQQGIIEWRNQFALFRYE